MIEFPAVVYAIRTDREGETKVTLEVPRSALPAMLTLGQWSGTLLRVCVEQVMP